ncbi:MAG TPA: glycosyltransferase 87 family protein, partial [Ktedonobacteraceae bacterium]
MIQKEATASRSRQTAKGPARQPGRRGGSWLHSLWQAFLDRRSPLAYVPMVAAMVLLFCGASWQLFWDNTDAARYQCYTLAFWQGSQGTHLLSAHQCRFLQQFGVPLNGVAPFHVLPFEYPPLTLSIFSLALAAPPVYYQIAFAIAMALVALLIYWLLLRFGPRGAALACAFYLVLGSWGTAEGRFDLVPAGLTLLCLIAAERRRWTLAYIALAFGFLLKIYPLLLLPALFMAEQIAHGCFR